MREESEEEREEGEEHVALEDSVEDVEGEECPLCGQRFGADLLQALEAFARVGRELGVIT
ncbi:MAG: hypothetical protein ACK4YP_20900 [Myxococcota bacterium]